jgi:uncharacterized protein (DUF58 family)
MSRTHVVPSAELQSLRDLELLTRATVEGLRQGLHRSPFHGYSAEFNQYRHYQPGDDLKYVDWKAFARTDRVYTRQFRETTNLAAIFVVDVSRSMDFGGKFILARTVAAILGTLVLDQGDAAGLLTAAERTHFVPPRGGHHHLRVLLAELSRLSPASTVSVDQALRNAGNLMSRRGVVVAISDFYEDETAMPQLRRLARMGHDVIAIQTLAAQELTLDIGGAAEVVDLETGKKLLVQPSTVRDQYARSFNAWLSSFESAIKRDGIDYLRVIAGEPLEPALRRFLIGRRGGN